MNYSVLKSGSVIKSGSRVNDVAYTEDTTLSEDLKVQPITLNTKQSSYSYSQIEKAINFVLTQVAIPFSTLATYDVDDFVVYDGFLYQCTTAIAVAGDWDASKWQVQKIFDNNGYVIAQGGTSTKNI